MVENAHVLFRIFQSIVAAGASGGDQAGHGLPCTAQPTEDQIPHMLTG